jgi:hypothetical protein
VWLLLMTWGHQSSVKSYNWRSSTSKTLLLRWLAQASNMQKIKGLHSTNNLPCINKGINNAMSGSNNSQTCPNKYLSFHSHPIFILSIYLPNSMEWRQCRAWKAASMAATPKLTWRWPHFSHLCSCIHKKVIISFFFEILVSFSKLNL